MTQAKVGIQLQSPQAFAADSFRAVQTMVSDPDTVLLKLQNDFNDGKPIEVLTEGVREAIIKNVKRRMTPQPLKIRADVELTCFSYDGVLHVQVRLHVLKCWHRGSGISIPIGPCSAVRLAHVGAAQDARAAALQSLSSSIRKSSHSTTNDQVCSVAGVQEAMRAAEKRSTEECPVKMKLVAPPLYVLTTNVCPGALS